MSSNLKKGLLLLLAACLLVGSSRVQLSLNADRDKLGLTRLQPLENAPPVLAFTTVALGGFRGLISNALWIRANDLQEEDKFFEMVQLADWITKLEPHFVQVWLVQAWNMAYNISVKFKDYPDRWRWVERGIMLLRDDGLRWNPNEMLIYRELGWFFQHKMGQNLDDGNMYYKQQWANEMAVVFDKKNPNLDDLIHPTTADQTNRSKILREKYKMKPEVMKEVDQKYGPLEWRLPEAHAIYWAWLGLEQAQKNPAKIKQDDLITLHRVVYQSMQMAFQRGKLVSNPFAKRFEFGPNLAIIPKVSSAYEDASEEDANNREHILRAHRNFLRDAVYFLYNHNRAADAKFWWNYMAKKYPEKNVLDGIPTSLPATLTVEQYAVARVQEDVSETMSRDRVKSVIEGLIVNAYGSEAIGEDERAAGYKLLARQVLATYESKTKSRGEAIAMSTFEEMDREVFTRLMDTEQGVPIEMRAVLRTIHGLPAEAPTAAPSTNAPPAAAGTNAPAAAAAK
ncbi:MAG: hypothetical protein NTX27_02475 [Verrucomicrobia bacterium]|nr:hypothetical protein [Verrucomicrobiota bacterium]